MGARDGLSDLLKLKSNNKTQNVITVALLSAVTFAALIIPALSTRRIPGGATRLASGYAIGFVGCLLGLLVSTWWDLPSGAVIVISLLVVGILFAWSLQPKLETCTLRCGSAGAANTSKCSPSETGRTP